MSEIVSKTTYYIIFISLMVLTALTTGVAFVDLGAFNVPVALTIAITKATLVILFFMHVKYSSSLTKIIAAAGFFWLLILFGLTFSDYLTRDWEGIPIDPATTLIGVYLLG